MSIITDATEVGSAGGWYDCQGGSGYLLDAGLAASMNCAQVYACNSYDQVWNENWVWIEDWENYPEDGGYWQDQGWYSNGDCNGWDYVPTRFQWDGYAAFDLAPDSTTTVTTVDLKLNCTGCFGNTLYVQNPYDDLSGRYFAADASGLYAAIPGGANYWYGSPVSGVQIINLNSTAVTDVGTVLYGGGRIQLGFYCNFLWDSNGSPNTDGYTFSPTLSDVQLVINGVYRRRMCCVMGAE